LLKLIAGLAAPSSGIIDWPESTYDAIGTPEPALGFVFQEPTLLPWRSVTDNVHLPLLLAGVSKRDAHDRIAESLSLVGLSAFADAHPRQLSGGMKMRVSIARALVTRPKILLMDEPFAALDEITRIKLNDDLLQLFAGQDLTVIFVTTASMKSVYLSNRIVVMSTAQAGSARDIPIEAQYPRTEEYRTSTRYNERCRFVSAALRHAMTAVRGAEMMTLSHLVPGSIRTPFARYSHAVEISPGARWLLCSGQLGISATDRVPESAEEQAVICFEAIGACLVEARMSFRDIIRINA